MRERASDRPQVADEGVGNQRGRVAEHAVATAEKLGAFAGLVPDERADPQAVALVTELVEPRYTVDVDDDARRGEAKLHQRDQALTPGQDLRLVPVAVEQRERLFERCRRNVVEAGGIHERRTPSLNGLALVELASPDPSGLQGEHTPGFSRPAR